MKTLRSTLFAAALVLSLSSFLSGPAFAVCGAGVCGDGTVDPGKECDDGNPVNGDGCNSSCQTSFDMAVGSPLMTFSGERPRDAQAADLDNDGIDDLLLITCRDAYLYSHLIGPGGERTFKGKYPLGPNTVMMDIRHLNGDHFIDAVTADADTDQLHIFFGNGDGTMTLANIFLPGNRPRGVSIGDLDTDGFADIAVACMYSFGFRIYFGDGAGNFPSNTFIPVGADALNTTITDLDGDGCRDAAFFSGGVSGTVKTYFGSLGGLFFGQSFKSYTPAGMAMDLNRDGYMDILALDYSEPSPRLITLLNQGNGTLRLDRRGQSRMAAI